jgi:hypothetical protein
MSKMYVTVWNSMVNLSWKYIDFWSDAAIQNEF